jgi:hypothetical protein
MKERKSKPSVFKGHLANHERDRTTNNLGFSWYDRNWEDLCSIIFCHSTDLNFHSIYYTVKKEGFSVQSHTELNMTTRFVVRDKT